MSAPQAEHRRLEAVARPKQARAERTLHRLLDAAEALIEEKGLATSRSRRSCGARAPSVGGFYARFRDKNELLRALEERFFQEQLRARSSASRASRAGAARRSPRSCAAACASSCWCSASAAP